jgi:four helix bundle protein
MSGGLQRQKSDVATVAWPLRVVQFREVAGGQPMSRASRTYGPMLRTLDIVCLTGSRGRMNDPEVTMPDALANTDLIAHSKALEAAGTAIKLVMRVPAPLKPIADQVIRSASSVPANLAEGHGRVGRDRVHLWRIAYASAKEVDSHLRFLTAAGAVDRTAANASLDGLDEVRAMTWRLLNPRS